ncbi:hypothetical protein [uncultured Psychroserpens sp.]|uniref:hypothetical protein n=1 Tax=uncultured Psychroserpens sp. TaxID=255436 RepID=UPI002605CA55|nr:hypothetical protein [uncultured Psychroserpens sp.]
MEALFHFIFQLFKIAILASIYASILIGIILIIGKFKKTEFLKRVKSEKKKYWFSFGFLISIGLLIFSFTYWGNHGLGDSARIPIGNFKEVGETNGIDAYIEPHNYQYGAMNVNSFIKSDNYLVGKTEVSPVDRPKPFFSWDLSKDEIIFYDSEKEYNAFADKNRLPKISEFKTFRESYREYWSGIRFLLLP